MAIDICAAPYNCRPDWTGSDALATDSTPGFQAALHDAGQSISPGMDLGGTVGDKLYSSRKGAFLIKDKLVFPNGVMFEGINDFATGLKMWSNFDRSKDFIDLGDSTTHIAAFGCRIQHCFLWSDQIGANPARSMVYTNNVQDTYDMLSGVRIYAGSRGGFTGDKGWGGATLVHMKNVTANNVVDSVPVFRINYEDATQVILEGIEPIGAQNATGTGPLENTIGMDITGGRVELRHYHAEVCHIGLNCNNSFGMIEIDHFVGHPWTPFAIVVQNNAAQRGKITIKNLRANASGQSVYNLQPGGTPIFGDIDAEIRL